MIKMKEKIIKNKKNILITLAFLLALAFNIGMRYLATRPRYKTLPEVRLVNQKEESTKGYAIMVPNESGDGYVEYEGDTWPSGYNYVEGKCVDNKGELVENAVTYKDGKVELQTASTVYCTLYFDNVKTTIEILREKDTQKYLSENPVPEDGGMYRYQAAPSSSSDAANMTNWICFGTDSKEECTDTKDSDNNGIPDGIDKYMYRIIGITEDGQMYLIKETFIKENNNIDFTWNTAYYIDSPWIGMEYCSRGVCPEWNEADLFKRLNGIANGTTSGSGLYAHANTNIFVDSVEYGYMGEYYKKENKWIKSEWYNLIEDHEWMYGDTNEEWYVAPGETGNLYNGDYMYAIETGQADTTHYVGKYGSVKLETYTWPKTNKVGAKISLMYIHDFLYSYPGGNPGNYSTAKNGWLYFQKDGDQDPYEMYEYNDTEKFSTRVGIDQDSADLVLNWELIDPTGLITGPLNDSGGARPIFYLSSKAKIVSGNGTKSDPYILSLN